jgi:Flp pilus assembly protein protease CpaA
MNNKIVIGLLGVSFVVLKLTKVIDWSWWYVTMPFWLGYALIGLLLILALMADKKKPKTTHTVRKSKFQQRLEEMEQQRKSKHS